MNKRILLSFGMLAFVGAVVAGGTGAFFSDTETSTGNVFTAGSVSVTLDSLTHQYYGDEAAIDEDYFTVRNASGEAPSFRFNDLKPGDTGMITKELTNGSNDAFFCARNTLVESDSPFTDKLNLRVNVGNGVSAETFYTAPFDEWYTLDTTDPTNPGGPGLAVDAGDQITADLEYCLGDFTNGVAGAPGSAGASCVVDASQNWNALQNQEIEVDVEYYAVQQRNNENFTCGSLNETITSSAGDISRFTAAYRDRLDGTSEDYAGVYMQFDETGIVDATQIELRLNLDDGSVYSTFAQGSVLTDINADGNTITRGGTVVTVNSRTSGSWSTQDSAGYTNGPFPAGAVVESAQVVITLGDGSVIFSTVDEADFLGQGEEGVVLP